MGCDIHAAIEYKENGQWKAFLVKNPYFGKYEDEPEMRARVDFDRDYDLFAILGNVRNGHGFAGIRTGSGFEPMSDGRGYPSDMSSAADEAMSHEHSATWVTLAEILAYDWERTTQKRGVVDAATFERWDRVKSWSPEPESYSGDVRGPRIRHISNDEMRLAIKNGVDLNGLHTAVEWGETYASAAHQLWTKALPVMLKLGAANGYDNVRLVMDFDS